MGRRRGRLHHQRVRMGRGCGKNRFDLVANSTKTSQSYGVFLAYYISSDIFPEASDLDFAFVGGINFGVSMLAATPVTWMVRSFGTHVPMYFGVVCQSAGYICASFATRIWHLYLSQAVLVGLGMGLLFIPSVQVTSQWFDKKRSMANGINSAGSGVGGIIFSFATGAAIRNISLGWALRIIGIASGVMTLVATLLIRNRNDKIKPAMRGFDYRLFRRLPVVLLMSWGFLSMLGYMTVLFSMSTFATSIGLSSSQASTITALVNLGIAIGRPLIGVLSDRYGRIEVAGLATLICVVSIFALWIPATTFAQAVVFSVISGAVIGTFWTVNRSSAPLSPTVVNMVQTISPLCVEIAGLKELPSMLALSWLTVVLPVTFSEVVALEIRRPRSARWQFLWPQLFSGLAYLLATIAMFWLWLIKRQQSKIQA
jgi:MFS family permease